MGFFLTFILMAYLNAVIDRTKQIETLVVQRTEELKAANEFNEKILKTIPFPMDIVDEKGSILFMSEKFKSVVGVDCTAKRCWEIYRDDKKQCPDCPLRKGIKVGETATIEANGVLGKRVFLITHTGIIFQGKTAVLELFYDITEYRKTEDKVRRLSLVVEEGPTAVIIVDNEGNIEYVNPKFSSMTQYASKEVLGKNPRILKSGDCIIRKNPVSFTGKALRSRRFAIQKVK
jgi:PAS domain-containing protein